MKRAFGPSLEESLVLILFDVVNHLAKNGEAMAVEAGLTARQWMLLLQVAGDPNFPSAEGGNDAPTEALASAIADARAVSRANVCAQVSALITKGMLEQQEDAADRRRKVLRVTAKGLAALAELEPTRRRANRALFGGWKRAELEELLAALQTCLQRLSRGRASRSLRLRQGELEARQASARQGSASANTSKASREARAGR